MVIDLCVRVPDPLSIDHFVKSARELGLTGFATALSLHNCSSVSNGTFGVYSRVNLTGKTSSTLRRQIDQFRRRCVILAVPLHDESIVNCIVDDPRIDLLTIINDDYETTLRASTAKSAAINGVALEVPIASLLKTSGLERSRILKSLRVSVQTALHADMPIVLSSASATPLGLRSPVALMYIGMMLGLSMMQLRSAVYSLPDEIVTRNIERLREHMVKLTDVMILR